MCGRFNDHLPSKSIWTDTFKIWPKYEASYNRAPTTQITSLRNDSGELMRWGMIPSWSKSFDSKYATFNARIETVDDKPSFRSAWKNLQTCLIPMAGYYEWKGVKGDKQPFYITDRNAGVILTAGLYEVWGDDHLSCTILTKPANDELKHIHDRMPLMLEPNTAKDWLSGCIDKEALINAESPNVIYYPVPKSVGNSRNDFADLIVPLDAL